MAVAIGWGRRDGESAKGGQGVLRRKWPADEEEAGRA